MKKRLATLTLASIMLASTLVPTTVSAALEDYNVVTNAEDNKVIFDTDMGYLGDDSYALYMLLQADAAGWIDLLGVTSTGANINIFEGTTAILNQLEYVGREDVPVYMGTDIPLMGLMKEETLAGNGLNKVWSVDRLLEVHAAGVTYDNLGEYANETWGQSSLKIQDKAAYEFMIDAVNENPGKVTIMAVGACTNVAMAIKADPDFASKTAGIYYMGGAIDVPGNITHCAEVNWYYDAEAVDICLNADWPVQVVIPNDISYHQKLTKDKVENIINSGDTAFNKIIEEYAYPAFVENPDKQQKLWDAQVPGIFFCPDLITETDVRDVAIETSHCYTYGESVTWSEGNGPDNSATCQIVYDLDGDQYWQMVADLYSYVPAE